ncbi:PREDICTED: coilin [Ficedula albicollis]|uniref:coilin n=1 Tax=Ficedula albicollis TaxID=59894 RepID=UPI0007AD8F1A|nr:PREDICTED: coilin [Ficedula albicollis]
MIRRTELTPAPRSGSLRRLHRFTQQMQTDKGLLSISDTEQTFDTPSLNLKDQGRRQQRTGEGAIRLFQGTVTSAAPAGTPAAPSVPPDRHPGERNFLPSSGCGTRSAVPGGGRLVTDLLSLIRHRFGFSRRARLSLFLEGALLPPAESARLVRDNDSLRVKLEEILADDYEEIDDGFIYATKEDKKRHRHKQDEEEFSRNEGKHKRKKKKEKHNLEYSSCREETSVDTWDSQKRYTKRKRKEEVRGRNSLTEGKEESSTSHSKKKKKTEREKQLATKKTDEKQTKVAAAKITLERANESFSLNSGKNSSKEITTRSRKKRVGASDSSSTSSDSDSSELNVKENKSSHKTVVVTLPKDKSQAASDSDVKTNKVAVKSNTMKTKTAISKNAKKPQSSSSDSDSSTEDEKVTPAQDSTAKEKSVPNHVVAVKASTKAPKAQSSSSDSDSSDSDTLVIKKSAAGAGLGNSMVRNCTNQLPASAQGSFASPGRGRGRGSREDNFWRGPRGHGFRGMMRGHGRGANPGFFYNYSSEGQKQRQLNEAATNTSVVIQNPVEIPKRDYSALPLLAAPPQVGERIAFKRLELTENYSPEVSDYKEAKIISWNAEKKQIELEILSTSAGQFAKEPGKFDLVYQSADGEELIEYAVPQDTKITESWDALIEPRLIVEPPVNGSSVEN